MISPELQQLPCSFEQVPFPLCALVSCSEKYGWLIWKNEYSAQFGAADSPNIPLPHPKQMPWGTNIMPAFSHRDSNVKSQGSERCHFTIRDLRVCPRHCPP